MNQEQKVIRVKVGVLELGEATGQRVGGVPFGEGKVSGQDDGGFFGPFGHDLKQEFSAHFSQWHIADFIEGDKVITGPAGATPD